MIRRTKMLREIREFIYILWKMHKDGDFIPYDKIKRRR